MRLRTEMFLLGLMIGPIMLVVGRLASFVAIFDPPSQDSEQAAVTGVGFLGVIAGAGIQPRAAAEMGRTRLAVEAPGLAWIALDRPPRRDDATAITGAHAPPPACSSTAQACSSWPYCSGACGGGTARPARGSTPCTRRRRLPSEGPEAGGPGHHKRQRRAGCHSPPYRPRRPRRARR